MCFVSFSTSAGSSNLLPTRELVVSQSVIFVWMCEHVLLEPKRKVVNALLYVNTVVLLTVILLVVLHLETKSSLKIHFLSLAILYIYSAIHLSYSLPMKYPELPTAI